MKKFLLTLAFVILGLVAFPKEAHAACSTAIVNPTTGPAGTNFTGRLEGCTPDITSLTYQVTLYKQGKVVGTFPLQTLGVGIYGISFGSPDEGSYSAVYNAVGGGGFSMGVFTVTPPAAPDTTKLVCQKINSVNYCMKCTFQGAVQVSCGAPSLAEIASCPAACQAVIDASTVNFEGKCDPTGGQAGQGIQTAIGCIPIASGAAITAFAARWGIGVAGGVAVLLLLYAGFLIMTSQGDPKRLQAGQELLTSAIAGVIMIIFSVFILRVLSIDILGLF